MSSSGSCVDIITRAYDKYAVMLYRLCVVQLGNKADAEDVVQDVFVKYMSVMPCFNDCEHEKAWFIRVAVNRCHDKRRAKFFKTAVPLDSVAQLAADAEPSPVPEELAALPEKYRMPIMLHYVEGYSVKEIAELLELTQSAVKVRLHRGRQQLKLELEESYVYV